jgi:HK97 gp10 family phage protein
MELDTKVHGLRELDAQIAKLDAKTQLATVRKALMFATLPVLKAARANAPKGESGLLRRSITRVTEKPRGLEKQISVAVGPKKSRSKGDPFYWRFVEFGTRHSKASPFLLPAWRAHVQDMLDRFALQLRKVLTKVGTGG